MQAFKLDDAKTYLSCPRTRQRGHS
jgi:hypothetical protein